MECEVVGICNLLQFLYQRNKYTTYVFFYSDANILAEVKKWAEPLDVIRLEEVGETLVFLDGQRVTCRVQECSLGSDNLLSDILFQL